VIYGADVSSSARELTAPRKADRLPAKWYSIHRGYLRVIKGFLREIKLMYKERVKEHNCLFRATYLLKILDHFAQELPSIAKGAESRWRSRALNPLLQRQLLGVPDQEPNLVRIMVGSSKDEAAAAYLTRDPLDPSEVQNLLRRILYVWPVRWSLSYLYKKATAESYASSRENTVSLFWERRGVSDEEYDACSLCSYEEAVIRAEDLEVHYKSLLSAGVGRLHLYKRTTHQHPSRKRLEREASVRRPSGGLPAPALIEIAASPAHHCPRPLIRRSGRRTSNIRIPNPERTHTPTLQWLGEN
jgi:hypothetical protein